MGQPSCGHDVATEPPSNSKTSPKATGRPEERISVQTPCMNSSSRTWESDNEDPRPTGGDSRAVPNVLSTLGSVARRSA